MSGQGEPAELIEASEEALRRAIDSASETRAAESIASDLEQIGIEVALARETGESNHGLLTGYRELDEGTLRGLWPGQVITIAGRPGMGKTTLGQNIAENVSDASGTVLFFTFEMSKRELQIRALARASKVDSRDIEDGRLDDEQFERLRQGYLGVKRREATFLVQDDAATSMALLSAEARRLKRTRGLDLIVMDYLQLMVPGSDNKANETAAVTRAIKLLARDLNVPIIQISQLNRAVEGRQEKRPTLADLRDSGSIEQDSDVVLFLYRDAYYNPDSDPANADVCEIIVAKNRKGSVGTEKLSYTGKYLTFRSVATSMVPA